MIEMVRTAGWWVTTLRHGKIAGFYRSFVEGRLLDQHKDSEMCKLVENSYRDVNIALANDTLRRRRH